MSDEPNDGIPKVGKDYADAHLTELKVDAKEWTTLYKDLRTGEFWKEYYPWPEMHGGGPSEFVTITADEARKEFGSLGMTPPERTRKLSSIPLAQVQNHHEWLRLCFEEELERRLSGAGPYDEFENIYHCALLLHLISDLEDIPLLYSAKCSGDMDLGCGFDWQFLFMREPKMLKDWARSANRDDIVEWIEEYENAYRDENMQAWLNGVISYHRG